MALNPGELNFAHVRRRFGRAAESFSGADFVHRTAADGLLHRMLPMTIQPQRILDLGSAAGAGSRQLQKRFRKSRVLSIDASARMLASARTARSWFSRVREVQADARQLPVATGSIDLVFANMLLPLIDDLPACIGEIRRVLREDGLFVFSTLGPDSLAEIRRAWSHIDNGLHVNPFVDMHNLGDVLATAGLRDPVLDIDHLTVTYWSCTALFADLKAAGAGNCLRRRRQSLTGKGKFVLLERALQDTMRGEKLQLRLELVYGHAWGGGAVHARGEFRVSPAAIGHRQIHS